MSVCERDKEKDRREGGVKERVCERENERNKSRIIWNRIKKKQKILFKIKVYISLFPYVGHPNKNLKRINLNMLNNSSYIA